ncbi:uncharacterized protein LOC143713118 [Siphateles boraxobius]|uniref:uncharacterized protein LOC143713118 n=1 Tax=Siphateles boraxobius TaxID=180520 RepID=UPI0040635F20
MTTTRVTDCQDDNYMEGRRVALEMSLEHALTEARKESEEQRQVTPPPIPKRVCLGHGKPRGRRGGRPKASATVTHNQIGNYLLTEDLPAASLDPQVEFEKNMESLSAMSDSPEIQRASSSWAFRQQRASQRWKEARPFHLKCLIQTQDVGQPFCSHCCKPAVVRCRECLPDQWFCETCDCKTHRRWPLHDRESVLEGFFKAIPPSKYFVRGEGGYSSHDQACILPTVRVTQKCPCDVPSITVSPGKAVILISINGNHGFVFLLPKGVMTCTSHCLHAKQQWAPEFMDLINSGYWPASTSSSTLYSLNLFSSVRELKVIAPALSRQALAKLLEHRTKCGGRSGPVCGDTLQRSFLEFSYCAFEEDRMSCGAPFTCPACTPDMLAISVDGNRKLYRFLRSGSSDSSFFEGAFIAEDTSVSTFVDVLHKAVKQLPGQGRCGSSSWTAAKETSRRTFKLDEEGMEVAVCRHGFQLKALNMFRGEIFAYPMYLHKELMSLKPRFIAMDVMCKYWPYLHKSANILPDLQGLTSTRPFLSVMHATAHSSKCEITWSGKNQEEAGSTAGEEVEQVNSYLSRCALTTKYMSKGTRVDMLTIHAMAWIYKKFTTLHRALSARYVKTCQRLQEETAIVAELKESLACPDEAVWVSDVREWAAGDTTGTSLEQSIEGRYLNVRQRKQALYRQNDSGKFRHRLRRKIAESKRLLLKDIETYNSHEPAMAIDLNEVEQSLSGDNPSPTWPWEVHGSAQIEDKLKNFNKAMLKMRLEEERTILVQEMAQHCSWLQKLQATLKRKTSEEDLYNDLPAGGMICLSQPELLSP